MLFSSSRSGYSRLRDLLLTGALIAAAGILGMSVKSATPIPDLNGVWQVTQPVKMLKAADGSIPPLLPAALKIYGVRIAKMKRGDTTYDPATQCKPMGEPRTAYDGMPFEILQRPDKIRFGYTWNRMVRFVDIQDHFGEIAGPTYYSTSIGHWDGSTLLITAKGFNDETLLDAAGMPHSDALEITESFRLKQDGNQLEERLTFKDPKTFSRSWDAVVTYNKLPGARIADDVCLDRLKIILKAPGTP